MKLVQPIMLMITFTINLVGCQTITSNPSTKPLAPITFQSTAEESVYLNLQGCLNLFYGKNPPKVEKKLLQHSQALCYNDFAMLYSGITKTPIWSAEHLTRQRLVRAKKSNYLGQLYQESRLPQIYQNSLNDFYQEEYPQYYGFLAPQGNMSHQNSQYDSFSLANAIPQNPTFYYHVWLRMEANIRYLVETYGNAYVVTGAVFADTNFRQPSPSMAVPSHFYKAVYLPEQQQAVAFISPNDNQTLIQQWNIQDLQDSIGIDVFPDMPKVIKTQPFGLVLPL